MTDAPDSAPLALPTIGRILHYILPDGPNAVEHRPALVVRAWGQHAMTAPEYQDEVNVIVFFDGCNDFAGQPLSAPLQVWKTCVRYADPETATPGTWHWPERA